jgi:hypothetical protein
MKTAGASHSRALIAASVAIALALASSAFAAGVPADGATAPPPDSTDTAPATSSTVSTTGAPGSISESPLVAPVSASSPDSAAIAKPINADAPPLRRPVYTTPKVPPIAAARQSMVDGADGTQEIPQAANDNDAPIGYLSPPISDTTTSADQENDIWDYQHEGTMDATMRGAMANPDPDWISPVGLWLREASRRLKSGEDADGLLVVAVRRDSPAEKAGIKPWKRLTHTLLTGAAIAATMVMPPAIILLPVIDYTHVGESYDMIIGVDGNRVRNFFDFERHVHDARPGEMVYLNVVRNGHRLQVPMLLPVSGHALTY